MSNRDPDDAVDLSPVGTREMKDRIERAKKSIPVGGAPMPKMPRLDQPPSGAPRDRAAGVQQVPGAKAMTPEQYQQGVAQGKLMPGVGAAYMANQPGSPPPPAEEADERPPMEISSKDGPVNPPRPEGGLSQRTMEQLEAVSKANAKEEEEEKKEEEEEDFSDFDFDEFGRGRRDIISNKERRDAIEKKITDELSFEELILHQEIRQKVPILKVFVPEFRTPSAEEDLFVKRIIGDIKGSDRYVLDLFAIMSLCCGLHSLNGQPLPSHLDDDRMPDRKLFDKKMEYIKKYPLVIVTDLSANYTWFTSRVQKLLALDKVKDF